MAKKTGQKNADSMARIKFLYEASHQMIKLHLEAQRNGKKCDEENESGKAAENPDLAIREQVQNSEFLKLSRSYTKIMKEVSRKAVIRM